jgi:predicted transcriptional regulator
MIAGFKVTQVVFVAAALNLADLLKDGPKGVDELASLVEANCETLGYFLHSLVALGLCAQEAEGSFALTPVGEYLQSTIPGSLRPVALFEGQQWVKSPICRCLPKREICSPSGRNYRCAFAQG